MNFINNYLYDYNVIPMAPISDNGGNTIALITDSFITDSKSSNIALLNEPQIDIILFCYLYFQWHFKSVGMSV